MLKFGSVRFFWFFEKPEPEPPVQFSKMLNQNQNHVEPFFSVRFAFKPGSNAEPIVFKASLTRQLHFDPLIIQNGQILSEL
jgi:hypothetical protein